MRKAAPLRRLQRTVSTEIHHGDVSEPLREEHKQILKQRELIRGAADAVGAAVPATLGRDIDRIDEFLLHRLLPHACAEEEAVYATVGKILDTPRATATMSLEHAEISRLAERLRRMRAESAPIPITEGAKDQASARQER